LDLHLVADRNRPADDGSCGHETRAVDSEDSVHPHSEHVRSRRAAVVENGSYRFGEGVDACTGHRGHGNDRPSLEGGTGNLFENLQLRKLNGVAIGKVCSGQRNDAAVHFEEVENRDMLLGLWHPSAVCGNNEQSAIEGTNASKHVLDEPLMPWDVDEADIVISNRCPSETEINRKASLFLLSEPVRVGSREGFDE
jgi:hypothetical protein